MSAARSGERLVLAGPPRGASAVLRIGAAERVLQASLDLPQGPTICRAYVRPFRGEENELQLRLPPGTPPGTYTGTVVVEGAQREVSVQVEPVTAVRLEPGRSVLQAAAGSTHELRLRVANEGNVPVEVPRVAVFDLDDPGGQDRAMGRALRATLPPGERRVDRYFEELRESHGGEARVTIGSGAGTLQPGEARDLVCVLEVPSEIRAGRTYTGSWNVANVAHSVALQVVNAVRTNHGGSAQ